MTEFARDTILSVIERWGFPTLAALALGYFLRADLLIPLLEEHRMTVKVLRETQGEIAKAVTEQTRLLYALQPKSMEVQDGVAGQ